VAVRHDIRLGKGSANTQKGIVRFCDELMARVVDRAQVEDVLLSRQARSTSLSCL
jgi:hypothetical protein